MVSRFPIASAAIGGSARTVILNPLSPLADGQARFERNPFQPLIPDEVLDFSRPLHTYLQEQASILRETFERQLDGVNYRPAADLSATFETAVFPLGTQAEFFSDEFGQVIAIFCQFREIDSNYPGAPVGTFTGGGKYEVTNRLPRSTSGSTLGFLPQDSAPDSDSFGWVQIQGPNLQPVRALPSDSNVAGVELGWGATGFVTSNVVGAVIATQVVDATRGGTAEYQAGELDILRSSSIGTELVAAANTRIDQLTVSLGETNASIENLETVLVTADEAAATQIQTLTVALADANASIVNERSARIAQGTSLAEDIVQLSVSLGEDITSQIQQVTTAFVSADQALGQRITNLTARFEDDSITQNQTLAEFTEELRVLSDSDEATVQRFIQLQAEITDAGTGSAANALAIQALDVRVTANEGGISSNATAITDLTARVTTAEGNITGNATALTQLSARVDTTETDITANSTSITSLTTQVTTLDGTVSSQASSIVSLTNSVNTQTGQISTLNTSVSSLSTTVTSQGSSISANSQDIISISGDVNSIEARRTIEVNANNVVTGIELISGSGGTSSIKFSADNFEVTTSTGTGQTPFRISGGTTFIQNAVIENGSLTSASSAVTGGSRTVTTTETTLTTSGLSIDNPTTSIVSGSATIQMGSTTTVGGTTLEFHVEDDNGNESEAWQFRTFPNMFQPFTFTFRIPASANLDGPFRLRARSINAGQSATVFTRRLYVQEIKK